MTPADPLLGLTLGDDVVEERIGAGGMGVVYRAVHPRLKRWVAVKVVRPEYAHDAKQSARFLQEARALSAIRHKGIVTVENFGLLPDGRQLMVMEYLEGETLDAMLHREGTMPAERALPLLDEVLDALSAAHGAGVVHRDLKPSNVFVVKHANGTRYVKLVDFGLAKQGIATAGAKASVVAGTPQYISPEQAQGLAATPQSDLYCFGGMLFELLTGRTPFEGQSWAELVSAQLRREAPRLSSVLPGTPEVLDQLVAKLLAKDPKARPASVVEVQREFRVAQRALNNAHTQAFGKAAPRPAEAGPSLTEVLGVKRRWAAAGSPSWIARERSRTAIGRSGSSSPSSECRSQHRPEAPVREPSRGGDRPVD